MKKNKRKIIGWTLSLAITTSVIGAAIGLGIILSMKKNSQIQNNPSEELPEDPTDTTPVVPETPVVTDELYPEAPWNTSQLFSKNDEYKITNEQNTNLYFETSNGYLERIIERDIERQPVTEIYDTPLMQEWKSAGILESRDNNGYPGYDYNYQIINSYGTQYEKNFLETYYEKVKSETAQSPFWNSSKNGTVKWNDSKFIINEIKNNNLKKHPAADKMHDPNLFVKPETKAIIKEFMFVGSRESVYNTGIYAPAGEVLTLELTPEQFNLWKSNRDMNIKILVNYQFFDNPQVIGDNGMISDKYPYTRVEFSVNKFGSLETLPTTSDWIYDITDGLYKFRFGSPFGGSVAIQYTNPLYINNEPIPIKFRISGGIEEVHYIQGQTTEEEWYDQIKRVKTGEITAPNIAIDSYWLNAVCNMYNMYQFYNSVGIPTNKFKSPESNHITTTNDIRIGGYGYQFTFSSEKKLDQLTFPYEMVKKWDTFLMLSNFIARGDVTNAPYKENMRFGLEVWGNALGWGKPYNFWTYPDTFIQMFFSSPDVLSASGNWLAMHEINHGYEVGNWNFKNLEHGSTNQITALNLTVMGDIARYRNLFNINGEWNNGWSRLLTPYGNVMSEKLDCYSIFCDYLYMVGTGKTYEYIRWQQENAGKNGYLDYGGLNEIYVMSRFAGQNFYYALRDLYAGKNFLPISKDGTNLSSSDEQLVNELSKLPSIDILGNIYASGIYLYDYLTEQYVYTNDVVPAFEIPAGIESYTFDFEQGIKSRNKDFQFEISNFPSTTKLGGKLVSDPNNPKKLIYTPPVANSIDDYGNIDEFDLEIRATHDSKYPNYVPGYKFKIKIRQNYKGAHININGVDYVAEQEKFVETKVYDLKLEANFLVPETGTYSFTFPRVAPKLYLNGEQILNVNQCFLKKGDVVKIEYFHPGYFEKYFGVSCNNKSIDLFEHLYSPYIDSNLINLNINENQNIKYQPRFASTNGIGNWAFNHVQQPYEQDLWETIDPKKYQLTYTHGGSEPLDASDLKYKNECTFRIIGSNINTIPTAEFQYNFDNPTTIGSLVFYSYQDWQPKGFKIKCTQVDGTIVEIKDTNLDVNNPNNYINYSNLSNVPYETSYKYFNLDQPIENVTKMELIIEKETTRGWLELIWINVLSNKIDSNISNLVPSNSSFIEFSPNWNQEVNSFDEDKNFSMYNNTSKVSSKSGSYFEFEIFGNGFTIIGKKPSIKTMIDVYIDDQLVKRDFDISSGEQGYNKIIYSWFSKSSKNKNIKVKIVLKSDSKLYINGIGISSFINTNGKIVKLKTE